LCFSRGSTHVVVVSKYILSPPGSALHWQKYLPDTQNHAGVETDLAVKHMHGKQLSSMLFKLNPCVPSKTKSVGFFPAVSDVNSKGGIFLDLLARSCGETVKAAYGKNTRFI